LWRLVKLELPRTRGAALAAITFAGGPRQHALGAALHRQSSAAAAERRHTSKLNGGKPRDDYFDHISSRSLHCVVT
jgi:hypothetical protein